MHFQKLSVLASALLAQEAVAAVHGRHLHQKLHGKKDIVYAHTEIETVVDYVTVTVWGPPEETPAPAKVPVYKGNNAPPQPQPAPPAPVTTSAAPPPPSTTLTTAIKPKETVPVAPQVHVAQVEQAPAPKVEQAPAPKVDHGAAKVSVSPPSKPSSAPSTGSPAGGKRGLAYNSGSLLAPFLNSGTQCTWSYNWGQTPDPAAPSDLEHVPMLWAPIQLHEPTWASNVEKAIAKGAKNILSFNECDHASQCNMSPASAAAGHIRLMNPYSGKVRIGAPAITNSGSPGQGLDWLQQWLDSCGGKCAFDFCPIHWYSPADPAEFINHVKKAQKTCGKPVWITEFAPFGSPDEIDAFLQEVMPKLDADPNVERYSYFMVQPGSMVSNGNSLSKFGKTFAYGA